MAQLTRKAIIQSFLNLLSERSFEKITVKDIVEDCGITRNTFYYHFEDVFAVLNAVLQIESQKLLDLRGASEGWRGCWRLMYRFLAENRRLALHLYNSSRRDELTGYLDRTLSQVIDAYVEDASAGVAASEEDKKLLSGFYRCALAGLIYDWLESGAHDMSQDTFDRVFFLMDGAMEAALGRSAQSERS